jgi:hypothetical protein
LRPDHEILIAGEQEIKIMESSMSLKKYENEEG